MAEGGATEVIPYDRIPLSAMNSSSRRKLAMALNPDMLLPGRNGFVRNWEGLAELVQIPYATVRLLETRDNPTRAVLELWEERRNPTIGELLSNLEELERFEVIDDIMPLLKRDALSYLSLQEESRREYDATCPIQVGEVTGGFVQQQATLTVGDFVIQSKHPELGFFESARYDAYVSYTESDVMFVTTLISKLEGEFKLKLFVKDRDLLPGVLEYEAEIKMLHERCERILLVLSEEFLFNPRCEFQTMFAQALAVDNNLYARKVIPIIYKPCEIPVGLKYIAKLDYSKLDVFGSFWTRLFTSISSPMYSDTRCERLSPSPFQTISSGSSPNQSRHMVRGQPNLEASQVLLPPDVTGYGSSSARSSGTFRSHLLNEPGPSHLSLSLPELANPPPPSPSSGRSVHSVGMEVDRDSYELGNLSLEVDNKSGRSRTKKDPPTTTTKKKKFFFQKRTPDSGS